MDGVNTTGSNEPDRDELLARLRDVAHRWETAKAEAEAASAEIGPLILALRGRGLSYRQIAEHLPASHVWAYRMARAAENHTPTKDKEHTHR